VSWSDGTSAGPVVVVGSCNLDQVLRVQRFPGTGETVGAHDVRDEAGGKGLNQAVAVARMGTPVRMVAAVGDDPAAQTVLAALADAGVDAALVRRVPGPTGRAVVFLDDDHDNRIVVAPCANAELVDLDAGQRAAIEGAAALLLQLEVPLATVTAAAQLAAAAGVRVCLTPAPVQELPPALLDATSLLFANESEALRLAGTSDVDEAVERLLAQVPEVVVTRGARGSDYASRDGARLHVDARAVTVRDTTAAGDVYAGAFTASRCRGDDVRTAMVTATAAAALAVQRPGSSSAAPTRAEVAGLLA
jgi:ribokinase